MLDLIIAEIKVGKFEFAKRLPYSPRKEYFNRLEGRTYSKTPEEVFFKEYVEKWWREIYPRMTASKARDYESILRVHHLLFSVIYPSPNLNQS